MRIRWQALRATATLVSLASASAATGQTESPDAAAVFDQPGLTLALGASDSATDARVARLAALYVPEGRTASPFLDAGPFEAAFRGAIELDLNDSYRFSVRGSGTLQLSIGGEVVIARQELPAGDAPLSSNGEVRLNKGLNPIELVYHSPTAGDASLRLTWDNDYLPEEPLPPERLRRADSPALHRGRARRTARDLVANAMCVRCHAAASGPSDGMPELQATGPALDDIGARLRPRWIEQWLLDPKALRPQARMPRLLSTEVAEARRQAADIAAYLTGGLGDDPAPDPATATPAAEIADGRRLYTEIGCAACHGDATARPGMDAAPRLVASPAFDAATSAAGPPGAPTSPPETGAPRRRSGRAPRRPPGATASPPASGGGPPGGGQVPAASVPPRPKFSVLGRLREELGAYEKDAAGSRDQALRLGDKWQPPALAAYLLNPNRFDPWSRMPRTELEAGEAASLAAYLLAPTPENGEGPPVRRDPPGDPERGRRLAEELRCRSCHSLPGGDPPPAAAPLERLADANRIRAANADGVARHPRYDFKPAEFDAIERLLAEDAAAFSRAVPVEYAERRLKAGGCLACHTRDGVPASWSPPPVAATVPAGESAADDFFAPSADAEDGAGPDHLPPDLTWAGAKLRSDWLEAYVAGRGQDRPRPHLRVRMPAFPGHADLLAAGLHHQHGLSPSPPEPEPVDPELAAVGGNLVRGDRLGCHSCHALGQDPALGGEGSEETINFDLVRRRLRRAYFDRFLRDPQRILPGSKMPRFVDEDGYTALYDILDGEASRQFEAIWHYLGALE